MTAILFSELYSAYYTAVAKILEAARKPGFTERRLQRFVEKEAFSESVLTILPALRSGRWPLLHADGSPVLRHRPTMPLTLLQKRWLKALSLDPRIRLFGAELPGLEDVEPLFTPEDYRVYDRYADGDPYEDERYIRHFRLMLAAIREKRPVEATMINRYGKAVWLRFRPQGLEYSAKDDKFRVLAKGCRFGYFNLGRITGCEFYTGHGQWQYKPQPDEVKDLTLEITDERNTLERCMLHFAHFEKRAERLENGRYLLHLKYYGNDETEMVIRVLSFGPCIRVLEPQSFAELIKERLLRQKSCGLR